MFNMLDKLKSKSTKHEITAIPALLELIDIKGAIVTIDAMGTQTEIVRLIRAKKADYVLTLKSNHPTLYSQVQKWLDAAIAKNFEGIKVDHDRRVEKAHRPRVNGLLSVRTEQAGHHRREKRLVWAVSLAEFGGLYKQEQWLGLQSIVMVERTRHLWNKFTHEVHFYLSSLPCLRSCPW